MPGACQGNGQCAGRDSRCTLHFARYFGQPDVEDRASRCCCCTWLIVGSGFYWPVMVLGSFVLCVNENSRVMQARKLLCVALLLLLCMLSHLHKLVKPTGPADSVIRTSYCSPHPIASHPIQSHPIPLRPFPSPPLPFPHIPSHPLFLMRLYIGLHRCATSILYSHFHVLSLFCPQWPSLSSGRRCEGL